MASRAPRAWLDVFVIAGFLLAIGTPAVMTVASPSAASVRNEFRKPAELPGLPTDSASLKAFPGGFDAWFKDSFWPRPRLIRWHNAIKLFALRVTPHPSIEVGKDGWLELGGETYRACTRGSDPFTEQELDLWVEALRRRDAWCRDRGADFLFVIAPNKATVYPEHLPSSFDPVGPTRFDQLLAALRERTEVEALDLRPALARAKQNREIYFPLGTHWNAYGAAAAYRELLRWIGERRPGVAPVPFGSLTWSHGTGGDSWAPKLYLADLLTQENPGVMHPQQELLKHEPFELVPSPQGRTNELVRGPDATAPRLLVLHDSFAELLVDLMSPHFSESVWIWSDKFIPAAMEQARPDVVVLELVERELHGELPDPEAEFGKVAEGGGE
jgi:hypothetical protein